jgi:WD40 repeat protein/serine/threonine protein kinase
MAAENASLDTIFCAAIEIASEAERAAYLARACGEDHELRARVKKLLDAHFRAGSFLEEPVQPTGSRATDAPVSSSPKLEVLAECPGTHIGPYKLLQQLGEGGMGVVYMAEQEQPVRRKVALKIIKPGMDSAQVIARFEAERQALALMDHLNIARVLDAGATAGGRPYFVMELVHGVPITRYCDDNRLTPRERLELFIPVCQAHAHQKGIIHRDIKPSNVMVCLYDGKPVPKVIDFGVAKAIEQRLTERTLFTQYGTIVGTFEYMAPEQAELSQLGVDTRSDLYALGVLLYELLTGTTPLESKRLQEAAYHEIVRLIKEEEPPRPSRRLSSSGAALAMISQQRRTEPAKLTKLVRGELDWIVMKCLEKDRARRYDTANSLARDVEHYLHDEPVDACPPSAGYRLRKFARKYWMPVAMAVAFALLLAAGVVVCAWQAVRATRAEGEAVAQRDVATGAEREAIRKRLEAEAAQERARAAEQEISRRWYAASTTTMQQAWDTGQVGRLRALLAETETYPDRGFEWYYWQRLCHLELHTFIGHRAKVTAVSWSPDGKRLATASGDGTAKLWEAASSRELLTLKGHMSAVLSVCWSPDGKRLVTASGDGAAKVWDAADGRELLALKRQPSGLCSAAWSPDGKFLATAGGDGTAKVWDAIDGRELFTLQGHDSWVMSVSWSPDGKQLATGSYDGKAKVWDTASRRERLILDHRHWVWSVSWSPDPKCVATGGGDLKAKVWNAASGRQLLTLKGHVLGVHSVSWSPDSKRLATASRDGTTKVWDAAGGQVLFSVGHTVWVRSACWSPDGKRLATGSDDGTAKVWDASGGAEPLTLQGHAGGANSLSWSPESTRLAAGSGEGMAKVWEVASGRELFSFGQTGAVVSLSWSPEGKRLAIASGSDTIILEVADGGEPLTLKGHTNVIVSVSWSPDGRRLATGSWDGTAKVWEVAGGRKPLTLRGDGNRVSSVSWSPDGKRLATGGGNVTAKVWDAADGRELLTLKSPTSRAAFVSWSADGKFLATGNQDGTAQVWDAADGRQLLTLKGHTSKVLSVSWSPDGKRLATGSLDGTAKVWAVSDGRELLTLKGHSDVVSAVCWSPDGKRLATASADATVKVWEAASPEAVKDWTRQDRGRTEFLARNAFRDPQAQGFIQTWLLLLPVPFPSGESGGQALDRQLDGEPGLCPKPGQRVRVGSQELLWRENHSPESVLDFNAVLGQLTEGHVAYAACYVESDRARKNLWLQVGSDDQSKVYLNDREVYEYRLPRILDDLDTIGPVDLEEGTNTLLFKVANENEGGEWQGCLRFVDESGNPVQGLQARLTPE